MNAPDPINERFWTTMANLAAQSPDSGWGLYERLKRYWVNTNPKASPDDYDDAMARLKRLAGVAHEQ